MMIKTHTSGAKAMLMHFTTLSKNNVLRLEEIEALIDHNTSYKIWVNKLGGQAFKNEYLKLWSSLINGSTYEGKLKGIHNRYKIMLENMDVLNEKYDFINTLDFSEVDDLVSQQLPEKTKIDVNVHFIIDGYNGGTIIDGHNYTQCISVLDKETFHSFGKYGMGHELHHIGLRYWKGQDLLRSKLLNKSDPTSLAIQLIGSILEEGCGVYYFDNQIHPEVMYDVSSRLVGVHEFKEILDQYHIEKQNVWFRFQDLDDLLGHLLKARDKDDTMVEKVNAYYFMQGPRPCLDKLIGEAMVATLESAFGTDAVKACMVNLKSFLPSYNEAAKILGHYVFSDEVLEVWNQRWTQTSLLG